MANLSTQPYKGTRDFYPDDMRVRQFMFGKLRSALIRMGYEEYDGPMLEPFELYAAKTSEEIVNEQLYWLIDRGERKLAMRPEMTPTLARMVAAKQNELPKPLRWFSIPNLWRYERPQRGRLREHWQLNVDVFGGTPFAEDLEICATIAGIMGEFGARPDGKTFEVRMNHRALTNALYIDVLQLPEEKHGAVSRWLDAAPKMKPGEFEEKLAAEGLSAGHVATLQKFLKGELPGDLAAHPAFAHITKLLAALKDMGLAPAFRFDPSIMRGFMYYTGMVLEVFDLHPDNNRALFGGGRYDNLVGLFGGQALAGVGFGMGDVTFRNFLEAHGLLPDLKTPQGVYVAAFEDELLPQAQMLARQIREALGAASATPVMAGLSGEKPKKAFVTAEKHGCRFIVFLGGDEAARGTYPMKDTTSQTQHEPADAAALARIIAGSQG